jgi:hypothetical protein
LLLRIGSCESEKAPAGSVKGQLRGCQFLKKDPASSIWNELTVSEIGMCFNSDVNEQKLKKHAEEFVLKMRAHVSNSLGTGVVEKGLV